MTTPVCRRSYWGYFTGVLVLCFFLSASLGKIWKTYDVHIRNVLDVSPATRLYSNISKSTKSTEPHHDTQIHNALNVLPVNSLDSNVSKSTKRPEYPLPNLTPTKPKVILILAYMHTASTYIGELIHQHPGSFYEFEPLRAIQLSTHVGRPLVLLNGTQREYDKRWNNITISDPDVGAWLVNNVATCNHRQLDVATLINFFSGIRNEMHRDHVPYIRCIAKNRSDITKYHPKLLHQSLSDITTVSKCVHMMDEACEKATIRVAKYIRLTVETLLKVVQKLDNVKVIHLVRDPRAMMDSQYRKNNNNARSFSVFVQRTRDICLRMKNDLLLTNVMKEKLANVLRTWRYEDLADYPMATAKEIFKFIEVEFDSVFENYVTTKSIKSMKNSTVRQAKWRSDIPLRHLQTVDKYCSVLYDQLGYIPFNSIAEVRNLNNKDHIDLVK